MDHICTKNKGNNPDNGSYMYILDPGNGSYMYILEAQ